MVRLSRTVRLSLNPHGERASDRALEGRGVNGFAGTPAMSGLGRHAEIVVVCRGEPDAATGYLVNIKVIDDAVHRSVAPLLERECAESPGIEATEVIATVSRALKASMPLAERVCWRLSPTYCVEASMEDLSYAVIRQQFDFAAAHRLHAPSLSAEQNVAMFGKCNNPRGHGHNYRLEIAVRVRAGVAADGRGVTLSQLERVTNQRVIERFDHKHLNEDTAEFASIGGLNPSVENIAKVCYDLLAPAIRGMEPSGCELVGVTVWETDRTSCTYPG